MKKKRSNSFKFKQKINSSVLKLKKNPVLLLPDLVLFVSTYLLTILFYHISGFAKYLEFAVKEGKLNNILTSFVQGNFWQFIISLTSFVLITFFLGAGIEAFRFYLIKESIKNKKISLKKAWRSENNYYWKFVLLKICVYVLIIIIFMLLSIPLTLMFKLGFNISGIAMGYISLIIGLILYFILTLSLLFRNAILFLENAKALETLKLSYRYFKNNTKKVFFSWVIITLFAILTGVIISTTSYFLSGLQTLTNNSVAIYFLSFVIAVLASFFKIIYNVWSEVFLFTVYNKD